MTIYRAEFCPMCGSELRSRHLDGKDRPYCDACDHPILQLPVACADVAVVDGSRVLLIRRRNPPNDNTWALPGGVIEVGESPAEGAARELAEETSLKASPDDLTLFGSYGAETTEGWHNAGYSFAVHRAETEGDIEASTDAREVQFWTLNAVRQADRPLRKNPDDAARMQQAIAAVDDGEP